MAQKRGTKKGIIATIGILAAITLASFTFWFLPQGNDQVIVVSDFETTLDETKEIHQTIKTSTNEEFQDLLNGNTNATEYKQVAEISSSQTRGLIIRLLQADPSEEWNESYHAYIESIRTFNSYLRETMVVASSLEGKDVEKMSEKEKDNLNELLQKVEDLKQKSESLEDHSFEARP